MSLPVFLCLLRLFYNKYPFCYNPRLLVPGSPCAPWQNNWPKNKVATLVLVDSRDPRGSPRHHRIVLERGDLPASGKFPVPSRNQPTSVSVRWPRPALLRLRWSHPAHLCFRWSRPAHLCLRWPRPALLRLRWSHPAHLCFRWSRPAHLCLRWSRPAHLRLRWSRPAHLRLRWSRPAYLRLRRHCPAQRSPTMAHGGPGPAMAAWSARTTWVPGSTMAA